MKVSIYARVKGMADKFIKLFGVYFTVLFGVLLTISVISLTYFNIFILNVNDIINYSFIMASIQALLMSFILEFILPEDVNNGN